MMSRAVVMIRQHRKQYERHMTPIVLTATPGLQPGVIQQPGSTTQTLTDKKNTPKHGHVFTVRISWLNGLTAADFIDEITAMVLI